MAIRFVSLGYNAAMSLALPALLRSLRPEQWLKNGFVVAPLVYRRALAVLADLSPESAEYAALGARLRADETGVYALLRSMTGQRAARPQAVGAMQRTK